MVRHGVWFFIAAMAALWLWYFLNSPRPYDDDNIGRYFMSQAAWKDPGYFVDSWGRPLAVLIFAVPSLLGYWVCATVTFLISIATLVLTYRVALLSGRDKAWLVVPLLIGQPLFFMTGWSLCTEPLGAFCLVLGLYLVKKENFVWGAVVWSLAPLARTELTLILPIFAVAFAMQRRWWPILALGVGLTLYQVSGMILKGDPLFLLTASQSFGHGLYANGPFSHYFERFIFIVGPVVFVLLVIQLVLDIRGGRVNILNTSIVLVFAMHVYFYWKGNVASIGFLRHLAAMSPFMALVAWEGYHSAFGQDHPHRKTWVTLAVVAAAVVTVSYYSVELIGHYFLTEQKEYSKFLIVAGVGVLFLMYQFANVRSKVFVNFAAMAVAVGALGYLVGKERPWKLAPEHVTVRQFEKYYAAQYKDRAPRTMVVHPWFHFFDDSNYYLLNMEEPNEVNQKYVKMRAENLDSLPIGSVVAWDSHYSHRLQSNVQQEAMLKDARFKLVQQFITPDQRFGMLVFEKISMQ